MYNRLVKGGYEELKVPPQVAQHQPIEAETTRKPLDKGTLLEEAVQESPSGSTNTLDPSGSTYKSRRLEDEELRRVGIVRGATGMYYKTTEGTGGTIVLTPVDPKIAQSTARAEVYLSGVTSPVSYRRALFSYPSYS